MRSHACCPDAAAVVAVVNGFVTLAVSLSAYHSQMLGSPDKRYVCLGPASGFGDHYGARRERVQLRSGYSARPAHLPLQGVAHWLLADPLPCALLACVVSCACAGHFDVLMGKRVEAEVFPLIHQFLVQHDSPKPRL